MHESFEELEILPDLNTDCGFSCPLASEKISLDLKWGKMVLAVFLSYS